MFTIKVMSEYSCAKGGAPNTPVVEDRVIKSRVMMAHQVDMDTMDGFNMVTLDGGEFIQVPHFYGPNDWKSEQGVITSVFVENERGKTVMSARAMQKEDAK